MNKMNKIPGDIFSIIQMYMTVDDQLSWAKTNKHNLSYIKKNGNGIQIIKNLHIAKSTSKMMQNVKFYIDFSFMVMSFPSINDNYLLKKIIGLNFDNTDISAYSYNTLLGCINLTYLNLSNCIIPDTYICEWIIKDLPIKELILIHNTWFTGEYISKMSHLEKINIHDSNLSIRRNISNLTDETLPNLKELTMSFRGRGYSPTDYKFTNLEFLDISGDMNQNIKWIEKNINLKHLKLNNMDFKYKIIDLYNFSKLETLHMTGCVCVGTILDKKTLQNMFNLTELNLDKSVVDINLIKNITKCFKLKKFIFSDSQINSQIIEIINYNPQIQFINNIHRRGKKRIYREESLHGNLIKRI